MKHLKSLLLNERFILILILINAVTIFLQGFDLSKTVIGNLNILDNSITILFILEIFFKIKEHGFNNFKSSYWNIFDSTLVLLAIPSLIFWLTGSNLIELDFFLILRISRVFKFFRFIKFIPKIEHLLLGIQRALKSSILVLFGFTVFIFVVSTISCFFYREISPEYFGDPIVSLYSIFRIFTIEGWYEIPDTIAENTSIVIAVLTKIYFAGILLLGGVIGLSLVNSIFVDAMLSDNNDELETKINTLEQKIDLILKKIEKQ